MSEPVDVYWSFRSPYSYLAIPGLKQVAEDYDVELKLRVVLPIAVRARQTLFDPSNMKPAIYILMDSIRRAEYLGIPYRFPPVPDPIVQNLETLEVAEEQPYIFRLAKHGVEAQRRGKGIAFADAISRLIFSGETDHWDKGSHLSDAAASAGLDLKELDAVVAEGDHMDEIENNHKALDDAGHWGVPTMVLRGEPFFGQDRVDLLRWRLDQLGLAK